MGHGLIVFNAHEKCNSGIIKSSVGTGSRQMLEGVIQNVLPMSDFIPYYVGVPLIHSLLYKPITDNMSEKW